MKKFLLTLAAVLGFASQAGSKTQVTLDQLTAINTAGVMVSVVGRGWVQAQIDSSLTIDTTTVPPTLKATAVGPPATFVDAVTPVGTVDGVNTVFTLPSVPAPINSVDLTVNGLQYRIGVDFNVSGATLTFVAASVPTTGSLLTVSYRR